ncbi:hypothetical protein CMV30_05745 [Nibricoccus aquaticus]|uniref:T6SS immunity protein Tdi1 C-terminal domain-containing protein n=1 Tax=Nibricoccus aquaticus TaxID=2576891 RepID=A0A290Q5F0_9BACT|nr:T6SS immunity protein Tdi1 domain-containing protein [Nibricoccus aquaticus]ATC63497.1 hypothetical protein CMV30_05745 [Nibricoccus aquaticus]
MSAYFIKLAPKKISSALEAWSWLLVAEKKLILVTAFADVFFESADGIWFLDTLEGDLKHVCQSSEDLDAILSSDEGKDHYLLSGFVDRAIREGRILGEEECYDFRLHPVVGGAIDYSNIEKISAVVALHIRGQLHEQVRHLEPGTKISNFVFEPVKTPKPWWKLW